MRFRRVRRNLERSLKIRSGLFRLIIFQKKAAEVDVRPGILHLRVRLPGDRILKGLLCFLCASERLQRQTEIVFRPDVFWI